MDWNGVLVVVNHSSWIDVLALTALAPVRLVAKREVGQWPLIGGLARCAGALFIDRGLVLLPRSNACGCREPCHGLSSARSRQLISPSRFRASPAR
jgi:hypothetical protein